MSFGFGLGDIITLSCLSWAVYQACREVPSTFGQLSQEVLSLYAVLKETEEALGEQEMAVSRQQGLSIVVTGCKTLLEELQTLLKRYEKAGSKTNRTLDRMGWAMIDLDRWRQRIISNTVLLNAFIR